MKGGSRRVVPGDRLAPGDRAAPETACGGTYRFRAPSPGPGKAVAGGKKEVKVYTAWVTWREREEKRTLYFPTPTS